MIKEVLGIRHRVSSIQHQPVNCTHLSIPAMPAEKILCNVRVNKREPGMVVVDRERKVLHICESSGEHRIPFPVEQ